jgi:hypothetical protein
VIRHIALFKLKQGRSREDTQAAAATETLAALGPTLPMVSSWQTSWCFGSRPVSHDFALVCDVADETGLRAYLEDPGHRKAAADMLEVFTLSVADFVVP